MAGTLCSYGPFAQQPNNWSLGRALAFAQDSTLGMDAEG